MSPGGWLLLVVGCWFLLVGCWLLVVGRWLLGVGCWLLLVVGWLGALYPVIPAPSGAAREAQSS